MTNNKCLASVVCAVLMVLVAAARADGTPVIAKTAPATFPEEEGNLQPFMSERKYTKLAKKYPGLFIPITSKPALGPAALYGFGFRPMGTRARSYVLDSKGDAGFVLYLDRNGDGDLANDPPIRFEAGGGSVEFSEDVARPEAHVARWRVTLKPVGGTLLLNVLGSTLRAGTVSLGDTPVAFVLRGETGVHDAATCAVYFDTNGDGTVDVSENSDEKYEFREQTVNLAGRSYRFSADLTGDQLTLEPLAEKLPDRPTLKPGHLAPDFSAKNTADESESLDKYKGHVVLLDFWGMGCAPCVEEIPEFVAAYRRLHERGFDIIGVDYADDPTALAKFTRRHDMPWPQIIEKPPGTLKTLFRVHGFPTYVLIDREGKLVSIGSRPNTGLIQKIEDAVATGSR